MVTKSMPLPIKVVIAIIVGILLGQFLLSMQGSVTGEILKAFLNGVATLADLFTHYIHFFVPILIVGLVAPAIAELGHNASKVLLFTLVISYFSAVLASVGSWFVGDAIIPHVFRPIQTATGHKPIIESFLPSSFLFDPFMGVISAIALAFSIGLAGATIERESLKNLLEDCRQIVIKVINGFIVPVLPFYIGTVFIKLSSEGNLFLNMINFSEIILIVVPLQIIFLIMLYLLSGAISGRNPLLALKNTLPAYMTALGTQSSSATIPISLECAEKNGVSKKNREFTIPLCSTIHLTGSSVTQTFGSMAIYFIFKGELPSLLDMLPLIIFLGVILVAAPGVPGGAPATTVPVLKSFLGFTPEMSAMMYTLGVTNDSFSTAANVMGDGAIAIIVDTKFSEEEIALDTTPKLKEGL